MNPADLHTAQIVCTQKELDVCVLRAAGRTQREIAMALGISRRAVRDRYYEARRKIAQHQEAAA